MYQTIINFIEGPLHCSSLLRLEVRSLDQGIFGVCVYPPNELRECHRLVKIIQDFTAKKRTEP